MRHLHVSASGSCRCISYLQSIRRDLCFNASPRQIERHDGRIQLTEGECHDPTRSDGPGKRRACRKSDGHGCTSPRWRWWWPRRRRFRRWTHGELRRRHTWAVLAEVTRAALAALISPAVKVSTSTTREAPSSVAVVSTATAPAVRITRRTATGATTTAHTDIASCFLKGDAAGRKAGRGSCHTARHLTWPVAGERI